MESSIMLSFLSLEKRKEILHEIELSVVDRLMNHVCPICHTTINIPVSMTPEIWCTECGDTSNRIACLHCVREWLELNKKPEDRQYRKHLICPKTINTPVMNAKKSYKIEEGLIDLLDKYHPTEMECKCGFKGTRREVRGHSINATCPKSTWKCPACEYRGNPSSYILHTQSCNRLRDLIIYC